MSDVTLLTLEYRHPVDLRLLRFPFLPDGAKMTWTARLSGPDWPSATTWLFRSGLPP